MKYLFDDEGLELLEGLTLHDSLFAFDFDGTLSEIVDVPSEATISDHTLHLLEDLNKKAPTAVISGRAVSDLKKRVKADSLRLVGNHGLEGLAPLGVSNRYIQETCSTWKTHILETHFRLFEEMKIEMEDKGYSLAFHFRKSPDPLFAQKVLIGICKELEPSARTILGKFVVNVVPFGAPNKGDALLELMQSFGVQKAFFVGDDDTDEDVFSMSRSNILSVKVGEGKTKAPFYLKSRLEVDHLIQILVDSFNRGKQ